MMRERTERNRKRKDPVRELVAQLDYPERERDLHDKIAKDCSSRQWLVFHGSMAHRTHRMEGEPDFIIMAHNGEVHFIECKKATGKLTPAQQGVIAWAAKLGHTVHVVRSFDEFLAVVNETQLKG